MAFGRLPGFIRSLVKGAFWCGLVVLSCATARLLIQQARAEFVFRYSTVFEGMAVAPRLDPTVADYAKMRGDFWLTSSVPPRLDLAAIAFRKALELNPHEAIHWNDWGRVCWRLGRRKEAETAFATAQTIDSNNYVIQRDIGDLLFLEGEIDRATPHHARAIRLNPALARGIYAAYWNVGQSPTALARTLLGDDPNVQRRYFLDGLLWIDPQQAEQLWRTWERREGVFGVKSYAAYFDFLVAHKDYEAARNLWRRIVRKFYRTAWDEERDAFWNGRLDYSPRFDGGQEWRMIRPLPPGVRVIVSSSESTKRSRSLWIHFENKENVSFQHIRHFFFVSPGRACRLRYWVRAVGVTTASGPYVKLLLHGEKPTVRRGRMITGTGIWEIEQPFEVPADCSWAEIAICRDPGADSDGKIKGDVWYDDFELKVDTEPTSRTLSP